MLFNLKRRSGSFRWGLAAFLLGLPFPFIILALLFGGCK
jgi:hypothetical protein